MEKEKSKLRKLKIGYGNNKKREEARRLNQQFELAPGRVYSNHKKIIETQEGVDKPKYDHGWQDELQDERLFNDVEEASRFWKSMWETQGIGNTSALWLGEIKNAIRDSVPEMMEEDFELSVDQEEWFQESATGVRQGRIDL